MYATATVKARSFWTCPKCGKIEKGDTVTLERGDDKIGTALLVFDQQPARDVSNRYMPVGWASYGIGNVLCGDCAI
jgi:hypothetical protein